MKVFRGIYFDGKTARPHGVAVQAGDDGLVLYDENGAQIVQWSYDALVPSEALKPARDTVLRCAGQPDAVLQIEESAFADALLARDPSLGRGHMRDVEAVTRGGALYRPAWWAVAVPLLLLVLLVALGPEILVRVYPENTKSRLGRAAVSTLVGGAPVCGGHEGMVALEKLVDRLGGRAGGARVTLSVVNDGGINAFAAPGGHIVIMRGLLDVLAHEGELAFVMAHELSHLRHEDALRAMVRERGVLAMLRALAGGNTIPAQLAGDLLNMAHTRHVEERADRDAVERLFRSGVAPGELDGIFDRLSQNASVVEGPEFISTHPVSTNRQKLLQSILKSYAAGGAGNDRALTPGLDPQEWQAVRDMCGQHD